MIKKIIILMVFIIFLSIQGFAEDNINGIVGITNDIHFKSKWYNTQGVYTPKLTTVNEVYKNQYLDILVFINEMSLDANNYCNISYDLKIIDPEGNIHTTMNNINALNIEVTSQNIFLSNSLLRFCFEDDDELGTYTFKIKLIDNISGKFLVIKKDINLINYSEKTLYQNDINKSVTYYYENPDPGIIFNFFNMLFESDKENSYYIMGAFFDKVLQDEEYLIPHLQEYYLSLSKKEKEKMLYILKSIHVNNKNILKGINLTKNEEKIFKSISIPNIQDDMISQAIELDMNWASFFATGEYLYVYNIIKAIELVKNEETKIIGNAAIWSLSSNCKQHDLVKAYCINAYYSKNLDEFTKGILVKIINDNLGE